MCRILAYVNFFCSTSSYQASCSLVALDVLADSKQRLGGQQIDLLVQPDLSQPFARLAVEKGVIL